MLSDARPESGELTICGERHAPDLPVVIADESYVTDEPSEVLPSRKPARMNDETLKLAVRLDPGIGRCGQLVAP